MAVSVKDDRHISMIIKSTIYRSTSSSDGKQHEEYLDKLRKKHLSSSSKEEGVGLCNTATY